MNRSSNSRRTANRKSASLLALCGLFGIQGAFAQGTIAWGNVFGTTLRAPVYGVDPAHPYIIKTGNTAAGLPPGTQTYGGQLLAGTGFTMGLFVGGNAAEAQGSITALATAPFATQGLMIQRTATDPTRPPGTTGVHVQFRAWDNRGGAVTSWSQVLAGLAGGGVAFGASEPFIIGPLGGGTWLTPQTTGIRSFNLIIQAVPEPSVFVLGTVALGTILVCRRR